MIRKWIGHHWNSLFRERRDPGYDLLYFNTQTMFFPRALVWPQWVFRLRFWVEQSLRNLTDIYLTTRMEMVSHSGAQPSSCFSTCSSFSTGNNKLGGQDFTQRLLQYSIERVRQQYGVPPTLKEDIHLPPTGRGGRQNQPHPGASRSPSVFLFTCRQREWTERRRKKSSFRRSWHGNSLRSWMQISSRRFWHPLRRSS